MRKKDAAAHQESALGKSALLHGDLNKLLVKTEQHRANLAAEITSTDAFIRSIRDFAKASGVSLGSSVVAPSSAKRAAPVPAAASPAAGKSTRKGKTISPIPTAVRAAIAAQIEPWTNVNIRAHMDEHALEISKQVNGARRSQEVYAARKAGLIKIHKKGPAGGSHSYVTIQPIH